MYNFYIRNFEKYKFDNKSYGLKLICIVFVLLIIIKSKLTPLTYDEAYTYLNYVITKDYFNIGLANNHLLNTLLIGVTSSFNNSELLLRAPSVAFGIIYVFVAFKFSEKYNYNYLVLFIFLFNPLIMDFFSLARGYSISASLNLGAIYLYLYSNYKYKYPLIIFLLWLSSLAIFINLITLFLIIFLNYFFQKKATKNIHTNITNVVFLILSWPIVNWVFEITKKNKPLYGNEVEILLYERVVTVFGFVSTYFVSSILLCIVFVFITLVFYFKFYSVSKIKTFSSVLFFSTLLCLIIIPMIFGRPFPVNRVLIPFIPIFQLLLVSIFGEIDNHISKNIIIFLLLFNFIFSYNLEESLVWGKTIDINKQGDLSYCESLEVSRPEIQYYLKFKEFC